MSRSTVYLDRLLYLIGLLAIGALILEFGFQLGPEGHAALRSVSVGLVLLFIIQESLRWVIAPSTLSFFRERWFEATIALIALVAYSFIEPLSEQIREFHPTTTVTDLTLLYMGLSQVAILLTHLIRRMRGTNWLARLALRPPQLFIISFAVPIVIGTFLLKLPNATTLPISWVDALFTATSAVCVTGLVVVDTGSVFTGFGKTIIISLVQIGGLGIMTLTIFFATLFSGTIGVRERILMSDIMSEESVGEVRFLLAKIGAFTITIEAVGAALLYLSTGARFNEINMRLLYECIFHSISAFCNAGFSVFTDGLYDHSLRANYGYVSIVMFLIVLGGLGFPVLSNLADIVSARITGRRRHKILTTGTKLILVTTLILITGGTLLVWAIESRHSFAPLSAFDQFFQSLFISVTSRTAGYNIWPMSSLAVATTIVMMMLMWIGASPMSTGGGVKNITVAVAILNFRSQILGLKRVEIFGRQIAPESVGRAFAAIAVSTMALFASWLLLVLMEPALDVLDLAFEAISAFATVGLSRDITAKLSLESKLVIIALMFGGRVGLITVLGSLFEPPKTHNYRLLKDNVTVY